MKQEHVKRINLNKNSRFRLRTGLILRFQQLDISGLMIIYG